MNPASSTGPKVLDSLGTHTGQASVSPRVPRNSYSQADQESPLPDEGATRNVISFLTTSILNPGVSYGINTTLGEEVFARLFTTWASRKTFPGSAKRTSPPATHQRDHQAGFRLRNPIVPGAGLVVHLSPLDASCVTLFQARTSPLPSIPCGVVPQVAGW